MLLQTFEPRREPIGLNEFGRQIAALGLPDPPRNAGNSRTPSKPALLKAVEELGGEW